MPEQGIIPFSMDDLCHILPFAFIRVLSVAVIEWFHNSLDTFSELEIILYVPFATL
jgi:hypothetical protein